jgi:hypothetical protein
MTQPSPITATLASAIKKASALSPSFADRIDGSLRQGDFGDALFVVGSENRLTMLRAMWRAIPRSQRPSLLAEAISNGDAPCRELVFTCKAMREVKSRGALVISCAEDRAFFDHLPDLVTAYRGSTQAEVDDAPFFGVSWTTDRNRAEWFARQHGRFRRLDSQPVVLTITIAKSDISGVATEREEAELFIDTSHTNRAYKAGRLLVEALGT